MRGVCGENTAYTAYTVFAVRLRAGVDPVSMLYPAASNP